MHRVMVVGAGKIGGTIAKFLHDTGDYEVVLTDALQTALDRWPEGDYERLQLSVGGNGWTQRSQGYDTLVSALGFQHNVVVARAALDDGSNYFDLTEDVNTAEAINRMADKVVPRQIIMPQCGLAPGFISIAASDLMSQFEKVDGAYLRVGALPVYPSNALKYNLTWSTAGLVNEYCNPCETIVDGVYTKVPALSGLDSLSIDGVEYEVFNTSGGLGTLAETWEGNVQQMNYKTIRYPGHHRMMDFLCNDLSLCKSPQQLRTLLDREIPVSHQDVVIAWVSVIGRDSYGLVQQTACHKIYASDGLSAIQRSTAAGLCAVLDLKVFGGEKFERMTGFVKQEDIPLAAFLGNRFGEVFQKEGRK